MANETTPTQTATPEIIGGEILLALTREGLIYQNLLQEGENIKFTRDNLNTERDKLVVLRKLETNLKNMDNPWTAKWKAWNEKRKSLLDPVSELAVRKGNELATLSRQIEDEKYKAEVERQRVAGIKKAIDDFFIEQSQAVANTSDPDEIVRIEKLVGSNKANKSRYAEFLPLMVEKAGILGELIKTKKNALRELEALKTAENASNDDQTILDLREKQEKVEQTIQQAQIDVQEKAIGLATQADVVEPEIIVPVAPKARRSTWTWMIPNDLDKYGNTIPGSGIKKVQKLMPEWVELSINMEKVNEYLRVKKKEGIEGESFDFAGIRFFLEKSY